MIFELYHERSSTSIEPVAGRRRENFVNPRALGLLAGLVTAAAWGGMFPIFGVLLKRMDGFWLTSIRYAAAALVLVALLLAVEGVQAFRLDRRWPLLALIGTLAIAGFNLLVLTGMKLSTPEHGALMVAMGPAFAALVGWIRTSVPPKPVVIGTIVLAFVGVALVATKGSLATVLHGSLAGDAIMASGVLCFAVYTTFAPAFKDWSSLRFTTLSVGLGSVAALLATGAATAAGFSRVPALHLDATLVWGMLYIILFAAVAAFILWNFAIQSIGAQNTVLFMNAVPVVSFAVALVAGQRFSPVEYAGAALTIAALVASNLASRTKAVSAPKVTRNPAEAV